MFHRWCLRFVLSISRQDYITREVVTDEESSLYEYDR